MSATWSSPPELDKLGILANEFLKPGLHEALLTRELDELLAQIADGALVADVAALRDAEASDRVSRHIAGIVARAIERAPEGHRSEAAVRIAAELIRRLRRLTNEGGDLDRDEPLDPARVLVALLRRLPDGRAQAIERPLTPLLDTTVFTNAPGEPAVGHELRAEVPSADAIDVVMAFVRWSGVRPLTEALRRHCEAGKPLRILTTTYTNSTEQRALDELERLGAQIKVSYDTTSTRLHAKAWLFHRESGYSTAYIGSSNLTHSAQVLGLEWNVRVSAVRNPDAVAKMEAVFASYWASGGLRCIRARRSSRGGQKRRRRRMSPRSARSSLNSVLFRRHCSSTSSLLVTRATIAICSSQRRAQGKPSWRPSTTRASGRSSPAVGCCSSLIVRRSSIRAARRFGTPCAMAPSVRSGLAGSDPHASIMSLHRSKACTAPDVRHIDPEHFDVVIVDEFHHAAARSYEIVLEHLRPVELLGLTATPERADGLDVLRHFDGRIAADLRLWDAIDQEYLAPFAYFGVHDGLDLRRVPWRRGQGIRRLCARERLDGGPRVGQISSSRRSAGRLPIPPGLERSAICVSVNHARFMARPFQRARSAVRRPLC